MPTLRGNPNAFDLTDGPSTYGRFDSDSDYQYASGLMILPVASELSATVQVRQHGGYGTRTVTFDVAKQGNPPVIPAASEYVGNDRLLGTSLIVSTPSPNSTTGGYNWTIKGTYTYATAESPRIPGESMFPTVGYPYPNPAQDEIAARSFGYLDPENYAERMKSEGDILTDNWIWAATMYPSNLLGNPVIIGV